MNKTFFVATAFVLVSSFAAQAQTAPKPPIESKSFPNGFTITGLTDPDKARQCQAPKALYAQSACTSLKDKDGKDTGQIACKLDCLNEEQGAAALAARTHTKK